jgi:hypothetical protein
MAKDPEHLRLEASANLVRLIGEELVTSDEAAVTELVKNSYDAGAKQVTITIEPISEKRPGYIEIRDDGQGMSADDFKRMFMVAGYSERPDEARSARRVPTGEKGIGRFAAARLGRYLEIVTKASQESASLNMTFDWSAFRDKTKKINQIPIDLNYVDSPQFSSKGRGTSLVVTGLRSDWKRGKIETLRDALAQLLDPFEKAGDFTMLLNVIDSPKLSGEVTQERPTGADIEVLFRIDPDGRVRRKIASRSLPSAYGPQMLSSKVNTKPLIGVRARFVYYLKRPAKAKRKGLTAGVRVYRDGVRLEPFGSPSADWLGLSEKRARLAGHAHIVPSRLFGFVEVSRLKHEDLKDTTGRQALIDTEAAQALVSLLREQLGDLEEHVRTQVSVPRWEAGKRRKAINLERARLHSLGMMSAGLAHEMRQPLQVIRTEAGNITAGLQRLGIQDEQIDEAQSAIDRNIQRIDETIVFISELARGDLESVSDFDLAEHLVLECRFFQNLSSPKGIAIEVKASQHQPARISKAGFSMVLHNLWKNAVEALEEMDEDKDKRIIISLSKDSSVNLLEVSDNGPGISEEVQKHLFKEFATEKTGGMGIGLYNCRLIVQAHDGKIEYDTRVNGGTIFRVSLPDG